MQHTIPRERRLRFLLVQAQLLSERTPHKPVTTAVSLARIHKEIDALMKDTPQTFRQQQQRAS